MMMMMMIILTFGPLSIPIALFVINKQSKILQSNRIESNNNIFIYVCTYQSSTFECKDYHSCYVIELASEAELSVYIAC